MSRRRLTPEEQALWNKVARTMERRKPERPVDMQSTVARGAARKEPVKNALPAFDIGEKRDGPTVKSDVLPGLTERLALQPVAMDKKVHTRLKKGKIVPEGRIDLHGMTLARAQPVLTGFILRAQAEGKRLVLVITGKGKHTDDGGPIPVRHGILRHAVPDWLSRPPLSQAVLQIAPAHQRHGGGGAYYVYLRRSR
ncbi:Smr/MutS family protein [Roseovarius aestuariivivens]|uniref:Smr/MutS family protein n=1 Tax=Roseovarius aestuariivivens TaxID=1888910 RepID=UPI0010806672|nr:Smr/MutS family protein [Roseovarius aestuariivivens]